MSKKDARKGTPKSHKINLSKTDLAAIKRAVTSALAESPEAITTLEQVVEKALLVASGRDDPDHRAYAEAALRIAFAEVLPKLAEENGVVADDNIRRFLASFC